jgi:hypothetical protein
MLSHIQILTANIIFIKSSNQTKTKKKKKKK